MGAQGQEDLFDHARADPVLEAPVDGLVRTISRRQVFPRCAGAQDPQGTVEYSAPVAPRPAAPVGSYGIFGEDGFDDVPLFFGQVHP